MKARGVHTPVHTSEFVKLDSAHMCCQAAGGGFAAAGSAVILKAIFESFASSGGHTVVAQANLTAHWCSTKMAEMARGRMWVFLVAGALIGLAVGIVVSIATDVSFAPEIGLAVGLLVGWLLRLMTTRA